MIYLKSTIRKEINDQIKKIESYKNGSHGSIAIFELEVLNRTLGIDD